MDVYDLRRLDPSTVDVWTRGSDTRRSLARAIRNERRERGAYIVRRYTPATR